MQYHKVKQQADGTFYPTSNKKQLIGGELFTSNEIAKMQVGAGYYKNCFDPVNIPSSKTLKLFGVRAELNK